MDCKNCISALVCKYAQDAAYREKVRSGEVNCCDFSMTMELKGFYVMERPFLVPKSRFPFSRKVSLVLLLSRRS